MTNRALPVALALLGSLAGTLHCAQATAFDRDIRAYNLAHGRVVFTDKCLKCHEAGRKGAPVLGDAEDWAPRLEQPLPTLIGHAIDGHGKMPPKGDLGLTDQEVAAAVAYVVYHGRLITGDLQQLPATAAGPGNVTRPDAALPGAPRVAASADPADAVILNMFLMLMSQERWK